MKSILILSLAFILAGCTATHVPYKANQEQNPENAKKIIEQVVMEQPLRHRPEHIDIKNDYLGLSYGTTHQSKSPSTSVTLGLGFGHYHGHHGHHFGHGIAVNTHNPKTTAKSINERIYYSSIRYLQISEKGNEYIVSILGNNNKVTRKIYTDSKMKAQRFVDAMTHFMKHSPNLIK